MAQVIKNINVRTADTGSTAIKRILALSPLSKTEIAQLLEVSLVLVDRWERGDVHPGEEELGKIAKLLERMESGERPRSSNLVLQGGLFASRGASSRTYQDQLNVFEEHHETNLVSDARPGLLSRIKRSKFFGAGAEELQRILSERVRSAETAESPPSSGASAGKNTYTYDAHTYHTKVPPQGIAHIIRHYLPKGGLMLDPFSGSGMTGVAARIMGCDVILNELSPAASFISYNFTSAVEAFRFDAVVHEILTELKALRKWLYETQCRECGKDTETLYTVWSYKVLCSKCSTEFVLWDHCRSYGRTVREHKIVSAFPCPSCNAEIKKSYLKRTTTVPVLLGYKCCSRTQVEHELSEQDLCRLEEIENGRAAAEGFYPETPLPDGVNLNQPKRHGLDRIDKFYTARNLAAMSHIWKTIHRIADDELAASLAFAFTSLYQRVTKLSEFRFWGGSGNTANFNVPFIWNEANVFCTFERKSKSIRDHLETTASKYTGRAVTVCNSATDLSYLPNESVDFIFTDPPFGANINYSEMNILWESWLGEFTDATNEAIMNKAQNKDLAQYTELMTRSLRECYRVLRPGHWMLLVFMNSSSKVWDGLKEAVENAGFQTEQIDIFDKQHATFKQFVSDNAAGSDLVLHCKKSITAAKQSVFEVSKTVIESIEQFLTNRQGALPKSVYLHVERDDDIDFRMLYSEWIAAGLLKNQELADLTIFRELATAWLERESSKNDTGKN